jgi:hypothetical protein
VRGGRPAASASLRTLPARSARTCSRAFVTPLPRGWSEAHDVAMSRGGMNRKIHAVASTSQAHLRSRLKILANEAGSVRALALAAKLPPSTVQSYFQRGSQPSPPSLIALAKAGGRSLEWLLGISERVEIQVEAPGKATEHFTYGDKVQSAERLHNSSMIQINNSAEQRHPSAASEFRCPRCGEVLCAIPVRQKK